MKMNYVEVDSDPENPSLEIGSSEFDSRASELQMTEVTNNTHRTV